MKVSTKGRYGLEIVVDLAMHSDSEQLESIKDIAGRRNLSVKYLERIVGMLKNAGIVKSTRGARGGYCLAKDPEEITVVEILSATEGNLIPIKCLEAKSDCMIELQNCPTREFWNQIWLCVDKVFSSVTLAEILKKTAEYEELN